MGGQKSGLEGTNEIWCSTDGSEWVEVTASAPWEERFMHTSVVYDNKMWIIGGTPEEDVWYSSDGVTWYKDVPGVSISDHSSIVFDNKIWILGGVNSRIALNRVWYRDVIYKKRK